MKTVLAVLAVAAVTASAGFAAGQAVTPVQFRALSKRVAKLEKTNAALSAYVSSCLADSVAVTVYGGDGEGYVYQPPGGAATFTTSALNLTNQGDKPSFYVATSPTNCTAPRAGRR